MSFEDWSPSITTTGLLGLALWLFKEFISNRLKREVEHEFNEKLENLRSDIRQKEQELNALRSGALAGRANRQSMLEQRRLKALDIVWSDAMKLGGLRLNAQMMSVVNFPKAREAAKKDANVRQFFKSVSASVPDLESLKTEARYQRPYVGDVVWSYYDLYSEILTYYLVNMMALRDGFEDLLHDDTRLKQLVKKVMPHYSEYVDKFGENGYAELLSDIQDKLLKAIITELEGKAADQKELEAAAEIISAMDAYRRPAEQEAKNAE